MNLAEFTIVQTGGSLFVNPATVGALASTDCGVLIVLTNGLIWNVQGVLEQIVRVLHRAAQEEFTPEVQPAK